MEGITPRASEVLKQALALSTEDRGRLIAQLIQSLDDEPPEDGVEEAWAAEIKRRVDEIRTGKAQLIPWEEVHRRALARLRDPHR
jgi:putative addiction module component (TIGR02574 family)